MQTHQITEKELWKTVLAEMEVIFAGSLYDVWMKNTDVTFEDDDTLIIGCNNKHGETMVKKYYENFIFESVKKITKKEYKIKYALKKEPQNNLETYNTPLFQGINSQKGADNQTRIRSGLNPNYTLENFVMGDTNRLAFAIASSIANKPGGMHNPFFLYSGVGLGKTHLIQAIGNKILDNFKDMKVTYCTGENFMNELIAAIQKGKSGGKYTTDEFRKKYRKADVLIIDDIQFIAGTDSTQNEFFHTFNDLYMRQRQIVIASDRPPEEFINIEDRIISRFKSGIMADIQKPTYELRYAILKNKQYEHKELFPEDVIEFLCEHIDTSIRELEASFMQVLTFAASKNLPINLDTTKQALTNIVRIPENDKSINPNTILKAVCNYYDINKKDIEGKKRNKEIVVPRQIAMYLIYEITGTPYETIGNILGGRDHTTIMHGVRKIEGEIKQDVRVSADVRNIKKFI